MKAIPFWLTQAHFALGAVRRETASMDLMAFLNVFRAGAWAAAAAAVFCACVIVTLAVRFTRRERMHRLVRKWMLYIQQCSPMSANLGVSSVPVFNST